MSKSDLVAPKASSNTTASARYTLDFKKISIFNPTNVKLQPKLRVSYSGDRYEQEADRIAEDVMRMPDPLVQQRAEAKPALLPRPLASTIMPLVQRQPEFEYIDEAFESIPTGDADELGRLNELASPPASMPTSEADVPGEKEAATEEDPDEGLEEEEELLQPKTSGGVTPALTPGIAQNINSLNGSGQPLLASERAFFEPRFGVDFANVRVHSNNRAASAADSINARAFTLGRNVVFAAGRYAPGTNASRRLLAHELTHVIQQQGVTASNHRLDSETKVKTGQMATSTLQRQPVTLRRTSRYVSRAAAQQVIEAYLRRASAAQSKGQLRPSLKVTAAIRTDLSSLFIGDPLRLPLLDNLLLNQTHLHGNPALLARHVAKLLPSRVDRNKLAILMRLSGTQQQTRLQSLGKILKPRPRQASPTQRAQPVRGPSSRERDESGRKHLRKAQGLPTVSTYGPISVDAEAAARQIRKLITKSPRPGKPARTIPEVEKSLRQFGADALVPGNVLIAIRQAREAWDMAGPDDEPHRLRLLKAARARKLAYASPRRVARYLARAMESGKADIPLMLDNIYNRVRQRKAIYSELERIVRTVHKRLGSRAAGVVAVDVYFGNKLVRRIRLGP